MQCACPECKILMGHRIHGVSSECCCPECGYVCSACLGTNSVMSSKEIRELADSLHYEIVINKAKE